MPVDHQAAIGRVTRAIEAMREGKMVIMVDDEDRENEGDLVFAAEHVCPEKINFMAREARGLICLTLTPEHVDRLQLPLMGSPGPDGAHSTAFTVSIEARQGVTTGISAQDRAETIRVAMASDSQPRDLVVPGHVFPLRAKPGGVLERAGHTEGSIDLAALAGLQPAGVICEIMREDGTMARMPDLERFAEQHALPIVTIADLIHYRLMRDTLVRPIHEQMVHTAFGSFMGHVFVSQVDNTQHFALTKGEDFATHVVDVRVHRQRPLADVFGPPAGDSSRARIQQGLAQLAACERGAFVYVTQSWLAHNLVADLDVLPGSGPRPDLHPPPPMDVRLYGTGAQILRTLGIQRMRVHVATPKSLKGLAGFGLEVVETCLLRDEAAVEGGGATA